MKIRHSRALVAASFIVMAAAAVRAQWLIPPVPADQVSVTVTPTVTFETATGLYRYEYVLESATSSAQNVVAFALRVTSPASAQAPPTGWELFDSEIDPIMKWAATEAAPPPQGFVDDGFSLPPAARSIRPGGSLSGFTIVSADPPGEVTYYVQGETPLPRLAPGVDPDSVPPYDRSIDTDSVRGTTVGPVAVVSPDFFEGGRRPATDAFLVFVNLSDGDTKTNPTSIIIKFGARGETVDRSTFRAELNRVDVTALFTTTSAPGDLAALFTAGSSPLVVGKNVLLTSVSGIVPGTDRTARDLDRLTFVVK